MIIVSEMLIVWQNELLVFAYCVIVFDLATDDVYKTMVRISYYFRFSNFSKLHQCN